MIRDPSDGSVREKPACVEGHVWVRVGQSRIHHCACCGCSDYGDNDELNAGFSPVIDTSTSGLPITKAKAEYLARLEESRKWLENYVRPTITPGDNE